MSEMDDDKLHKRLNLLLAVIFVVGLLSVVNLLALFFMPKGSQANSVAGRDGKDAVVDYQQVDVMVQEAVNALPQPRDGRDGQDGLQGPKGNPGEKGDKGDKGDKGEPGDAATCRQIELRQNPLTDLAEYRYLGDDLWLPAPLEGVIQNSCGVEDGLSGGAL